MNLHLYPGGGELDNLLLIPKKLLGKLEKRGSVFLPLSASTSVTGCRLRF